MVTLATVIPVYTEFEATELLVEYLDRLPNTVLVERTRTGAYTQKSRKNPLQVPAHVLIATEDWIWTDAAQSDQGLVIEGWLGTPLREGAFVILKRVPGQGHTLGGSQPPIVTQDPSERAFREWFYDPASWHALLCLNSPYPAFILWGPENSMMYNQQYAFVLGANHPHALGQPYAAVKPEAWGFVFPELQNVYATGLGRHIDNTPLFLEYKDAQGVTQVEESYVSWSLVPIHDDSGQIRGVYIPNSNTTLVMVANRRLAILEEVSRTTAHSQAYSQLWSRVWESLSREPANLECPFVAIYCKETCMDFNPGVDDPELSCDWTPAQIARYTAMRNRDASPHDDVELQLVTPRAPFSALPESVSLRAQSSGLTSPASSILQTALLRIRGGEDHVMLGGRDTAVLFAGQTSPWGDPITSAIVLPISAGVHVDAVMLLALNTRARMDQMYCHFIRSLASQLGSTLAVVKVFTSRIEEAEYRAWNEEHQRMAIRQELTEVERRFSRIADLLPCGLWVADHNQQFLYANEAWYRISGHSEGPVSVFKDFQDSIHPDSLEECVKKFDSYWAPEAPGESCTKAAPLVFRWVGETDEGIPRWVSCSTTRDTSEDGKITVIGVITDISQRKYAESLALARADDALQQKTRLTRFVDLLSHELRNPMAAITSSLELITERLKEIHIQDKKHGSLGECLEETETIGFCLTHMNKLVDETLTLSKIEHETQQLSLAPFQPEALLRKTFRLFDAELRNKDISHSIYVGPGLAGSDVWLMSDHSKVMQILINYIFTCQQPVREISASVDTTSTEPVLRDLYTPPKDAPIDNCHDSLNHRQRSEEYENSIEVQSASPPVYLVIHINDTGVGLSEEQQQLLFRRFSQATMPKTQVNYGSSSGLGLYISRKVAGLLGGGCGMQSEAGKGSTFSFYIRASRTSSPAAMIAKTVQTLSAPIMKLPSNGMVATKPKIVVEKRCYNVLLVEDNLINQKLLTKQLVRQGCSVQTADHGGFAIDSVMKSWSGPFSERIDVCLMDVEMPEVDGLTASRRIREMEADGHTRLPILGVTANARPGQIEQMLDAGMDAVVTKPFKIEVLMSRVRHLVDHGTI